ncbi:MAG: hypothetical protein EOQ86_33145 [Mesorhizobium sp.]|nr:MAG: hypothetical protein EOQ85_25970 [Mesorhizobium sp.]RWH73818.1 MAG: hypothetical protein EOQ86_33145 [Mesorhizobium sp.]RWH86305.1 MAG: hypothetical protein EOQ87_27345 [Mesorhizobium sp.]RWH90040.1 MAG: hypothetical protein EOQ88_34405 [Mesorhizobium sp.]RWH97958.1 MAG: hypothetical protein EOQ89_24200 [Mesorhizobium sp.]
MVAAILSKRCFSVSAVSVSAISSARSPSLGRRAVYRKVRRLGITRPAQRAFPTIFNLLPRGKLQGQIVALSCPFHQSISLPGS